MADNLTPKQEGLCQDYIVLGDASAAYRKNYKCANMKPATINRAAKELMDNPKIAARIADLKKKLAKRHEVTVDSITEMYNEAYRIGKKTDKSTGMSTAASGLAKLHGLIIDKHETTGKDQGPIEQEVKYTVEFVNATPPGK